MIVHVRRLRFVFDMPHGDKFVGGVAWMVNRYMDHAKQFNQCGFTPDVIDLSEYNVWYPGMRKMSNILNMFRQSAGVLKKIKENPDVDLHVHSSMKWTLAKDCYIMARARKRIRGKICLTIHHAVPSNFFYGRIGEKIGLWVIRNKVDKLVVLSESTRLYFLEQGISPEKVMTQYTFHDIVVDEQAVTRGDEERQEANLVYMGTISRKKGVFELVEAVRTLKDKSMVVHMCGTFPDRQMEDEFRAAISGAEEQFVLHGYVNGEEKRQILEQADIMVLPSYAEGMPVSIMEGMACGCAIVSTTVGAIPEVIGAENGVLVAPGNSAALADAIRGLLQNRERLANTQKENRTVSAKFTAEKHIADLAEFISR